MGLYPYQADAIDQIARYYSRGLRKVLLHLATGGGKTHIFSEIIKRTAAKGNPCVMAVYGRKLVDQASQRLLREGVDHGVVMANHWNKNLGAKVQICSVDTVRARGEYPLAKLLVVDEVHMWTSPDRIAFVEHYASQGAFVLGVTATPFTKESLRPLADAIVHPITTAELIAKGFLLAPRYFAPSEPDMKGVKKVNGDFHAGQTEERMATLTGDIVEHWRNLGENRATICFAVNVAHSKEMVRQFQRAGIPAEHVDADSSDAERERATARLKSGEIKILSNVGILCTGVDLPFVSCLILARPTASYNLFIQQCGRGTRRCDEIGKRDFIILDHAGNVPRHGFITDVRTVDLDGNVKKEKVMHPKVCKECYAAFVGTVCPACGNAPIPSARSTEVTTDASGRLVEVTATGNDIVRFIAQLNDQARRFGYKKGWVFHQVKSRYGDEVASRMFPRKPWSARKTGW